LSNTSRTAVDRALDPSSTARIGRVVQATLAQADQQVPDHGLGARQDRLIAELETTDPADRAFRDRLRRRFDSLEAERTDKAAQLHDLDSVARSQPDPDVSLLDALPILEHINITEAPERAQRKLYDALQLQIHYDRPDQARFRLVLTDDTIDGLAAATGGTAARLPANGAHENRTPPRARTCASTLSGRCGPASIPRRQPAGPRQSNGSRRYISGSSTGPPPHRNNGDI